MNEQLNSCLYLGKDAKAYETAKIIYSDNLFLDDNSVDGVQGKVRHL